MRTLDLGIRVGMPLLIAWVVGFLGLVVVPFFLHGLHLQPAMQVMGEPSIPRT